MATHLKEKLRGRKIVLDPVIVSNLDGLDAKRLRSGLTQRGAGHATDKKKKELEDPPAKGTITVAVNNIKQTAAQKSAKRRRAGYGH